MSNYCFRNRLCPLRLFKSQPLRFSRVCQHRIWKVKVTITFIGPTPCGYEHKRKSHYDPFGKPHVFLIDFIHIFKVISKTLYTSYFTMTEMAYFGILYYSVQKTLRIPTASILNCY